MISAPYKLTHRAVLTLLLLPLAPAPAQAPLLPESVILHNIDAAVLNRVTHVAGFTLHEHYRVYRGADQSHPAAEMLVATTYRKDSGKTYAVLSFSGSTLIRKFGLQPLLENEQSINLPGNVAQSWFTTANYAMKLRPGGIQHINGRACWALDIVPKRKATNMIQGTLWVDAGDFQIARIDGVASRNPSIWSGTTHMMRDYTNVSGYAMATHARAESKSFLVGRTVVTIDYGDYRLQTTP